MNFGLSIGFVIKNKGRENLSFHPLRDEDQRFGEDVFRERVTIFCYRMQKKRPVD